MRLAVATLFALSPVVLAGPVGNSPLSPRNPSTTNTLSHPLSEAQLNVAIRGGGPGGTIPIPNSLRPVSHIEKRATDGGGTQTQKPAGYDEWPEEYQKAHDKADEEWREAITQDPDAYKALQTLDTREKYLGKDFEKWSKDKTTAIMKAPNGKISKTKRKAFTRRSKKIEARRNDIRARRAAIPLDELRGKLRNRLNVAGKPIPEGSSAHTTPLRMELSKLGLAKEVVV